MSTPSPAAVPVDPTLFASLDPPRLAGTRCAACGTVTFPAATGCARCAGSDMAPVVLAEQGTVWTHTVQEFEPKAPYRVPDGGFVPFAVGYVDLGDVIVESRLVGEAVAIGDPVRLRLLELPDGVSYAFEPAR